LWEDDPPAELRVRRLQPGAEGVTRTGRARGVRPGMPLDFEDSEDDGVLRPAPGRFGAPRLPWWRPASTIGRVFLALGALLVLGSLAVSGLYLKRYLERDARFRIAGTEDIQASGLGEVSRGELLPVFGEDLGRNVFFVPLGERRRQLEQIPWIEHATVMRVLPGQIRISVVERKPVAFTRSGQQIGLVDASGVLLSMAPRAMAERHFSFPVVTGIDPNDSAPSRKARMAVYTRLMAELDSGGQHNTEQISEIDLTDPEDARVLMPEQGSDILAHFGDDRFLERYQRYKAHISEWRQQYPHLSSVDLRYDSQVVLQMASGGPAQPDAAAGNAAAAPAAPVAGGDKPPVAPDKPKAKPSAGGRAAQAAAAKNAPKAGAAKKLKPAQNKRHEEAKRATLHPAKHLPAVAAHKTAVHSPAAHAATHAKPVHAASTQAAKAHAAVRATAAHAAAAHPAAVHTASVSKSKGRFPAGPSSSGIQGGE
jgi:cell division protein FtsQ